jgi:hypothetical protein
VRSTDATKGATDNELTSYPESGRDDVPVSGPTCLARSGAGARSDCSAYLMSAPAPTSPIIGNGGAWDALGEVVLMTQRRCAMVIAWAAVMIGLSGAAVAGEGEPEPVDRWAPVRLLEGRWEGRGEGFGQTSEVTHEWWFVMGGTFLRLETRSVARGGDGAVEIHEDVGFMNRQRVKPGR